MLISIGLTMFLQVFPLFVLAPKLSWFYFLFHSFDSASIIRKDRIRFGEGL